MRADRCNKDEQWPSSHEADCEQNDWQTTLIKLHSLPANNYLKTMASVQSYRCWINVQVITNLCQQAFLNNKSCKKCTIFFKKGTSGVYGSYFVCLNAQKPTWNELPPEQIIDIIYIQIKINTTLDLVKLAYLNGWQTARYRSRAMVTKFQTEKRKIGVVLLQAQAKPRA